MSRTALLCSEYSTEVVLDSLPWLNTLKVPSNEFYESYFLGMKYLGVSSFNKSPNGYVEGRVDSATFVKEWYFSSAMLLTPASKHNSLLHPTSKRALKIIYLD
jgi:hypothetical protein